MNRIFKVIYSKTKHTYVVASELAKSHGKSKNGGVTSAGLLPGVLLAALLLTNGSFGGVSSAVDTSDENAYHAGWGITIADETKTDDKGNKTTTKNVISVKRNLSNDADPDKAKYTVDGDNAMIIGGGSGDWDFGHVDGTEQLAAIGAHGKNSLIAGGFDNATTREGEYAIAMGGVLNTASGEYASVVGGYGNKASGALASIVGGYRNTASYFASVVGGYGNTATTFADGPGTPSPSDAFGGEANVAVGIGNSTFGGGLNTALNVGTSALGGIKSVVQGEGSTGIAGGSTGSKAGYALAAGYGAVVTDDGVETDYSSDYPKGVATAIGFESTADEVNTISFGHDAGDVSGYQVNWYKRTDGQENPDGTDNDYTQAPESVTKTYYDSAQYNRLVKVADGINDHDVVVMEQLTPYAKADASNITDADHWANAIGTDTVDENSSRLVTSHAVYEALQNISDSGGGNSGTTYHSGWGIHIGDETDSHGKVTKNAISLNRNLGTDNESIKRLKADGENSLILGGQATLVGDEDSKYKLGTYGEYSVLVGGANNLVTETGSDAVIVGGGSNTVTGGDSVILGGENGIASGGQSVIVGGSENRANGKNSTVIGGANNYVYGANGYSAGGMDNFTGGFNAASLGGGNNFIGRLEDKYDNDDDPTYQLSTGVGGRFNVSNGFGTTSIGGQYSVVQGPLSVGVAGGSTEEGAGFALAAGNQSIVTADGVNKTSYVYGDPSVDWSKVNIGAGTASVDKDGNVIYTFYKDEATAIGYQATANKASTISFGHDKGDVSGYTVSIDPDSVVYGKDQNGDPDYSNIISVKPIFTSTTYDSAKYNRLVKIADGQDDHDAVAIEQLKTLAAASDASNIGVNLTKVPDRDDAGNIQYEESGAMKLRDATAEEKVANAKSWGTAIGTGKVEKDDKKLVTGGTVFDALSKININSADTHIKDGSYAVDDKHQVSMAIVDKDGKETNKTVTISDVAKASEVGDLNYVDGGAGAKGNVVTNGDSVTSAIGKLDQAVHNASSVANNITGSSNIDVTETKDNNGKVMGHQVALKDNISVTGVTTKTVNADDVNTKKLNVTDSATIGKITIDQDGKGTVNGLTNTTWDAGNITSGQAATEDQLKAATKNGISYDGDDSKTITLRKDTTIQNVADTSIERNSKNAVNAGTVYNETRVAKDGHYIKAANTAGDNITALDNQVAANAGNIFNLDHRVGELGSRINKVGAGAAALAALHPLDFDPSDKWDFAVGAGNYRNQTAAAVGLFYRPNARSMFNLGWTMGDNRNMVNGGFSIKLGRGSVYNDMSKAQMAETIATQSKEISTIKADYNALKADNEAKDKRIDALEKENQETKKQIQEILAKLGQ